MKDFIFLPIRRELTQIVESIVIVNMDLSESIQETEYLYPWTAKACIFFTLSEEPLLIKKGDGYLALPLSYIVGPRLINDVINFGIKRRTVGITFKAGAFRRMMGIPVFELTKENIDVHQIFGKETQEIENRLKEAGNNNEILHIVEEFLLKKLYSMHDFTLFDLAIEQCVNSRGNISVEKLAGIACISIRQFERKCFESLGISPKLFARLTRFATAYTLKESNPRLSWLNIAHEAGYYDQMHLIRDFKTFSGYSPNAINQLELYRIKIMSILEGGNKY